MSLVNRGTKAAGGTNFTNATTIISDEVDTDFNTIYNDYNGSIANANISGSADIAQTKIADHGTQSTQTTPGTPGSESAPTTIAGDIERLRYGIAQVKFGNATDQGSALEWFERSPNLMSGSLNMVANSSFEAFTGDGSTTAPNNWTATSTPATQYDHEQNAHADAVGRGYRLKITGAGSANTGVYQSFAAGALRPSTTYLVYAMAKADSGDTARMYSDGADTELDVETTSTSMQLLQGYFTTDATPTAVTLYLVSKGANDITYWDHVLVVPQVQTPRTGGYMAVFQQMEVEGTRITNTDVLPALGTTVSAANDGVIWTDGTNDLSRSIVVPGAGYMVKVTARCSGEASTSNTEIMFRLLESSDGGSTFQLRDGVSQSVATVGSARSHSGFLQYINTAPTPGTEYTYKVHASVNAGDMDPQAAAAGGGDHTKSFLLIELIPTGVA